MTGLNPVAVTFWLFGTALGGLLGGWDGALMGLVITTGLSVVVSLFGK